MPLHAAAVALTFPAKDAGMNHGDRAGEMVPVLSFFFFSFLLLSIQDDISGSRDFSGVVKCMLLIKKNQEQGVGPASVSVTAVEMRCVSVKARKGVVAAVLVRSAASRCACMRWSCEDLFDSGG